MACHSLRQGRCSPAGRRSRDFLDRAVAAVGRPDRWHFTAVQGVAGVDPLGDPGDAPPVRSGFASAQIAGGNATPRATGNWFLIGWRGPFTTPRFLTVRESSLRAVRCAPSQACTAPTTSSGCVHGDPATIARAMPPADRAIVGCCRLYGHGTGPRDRRDTGRGIVTDRPAIQFE